MSEVVRLIDRSSVSVDADGMAEWLIEWAGAIARGQYGPLRSIAIVIETASGDVAQVAQSIAASDAFRLAGLLQATANAVLNGDGTIHGFRQETEN